MSSDSETKDHWSSSAYSASAKFVPTLAKKLLQYLNPQPTDRVLDIGCGDGVFTSFFAPNVAEVLGIDASPSMVETAIKHHDAPKANFKVVDCRHLDQETDIVQGQWDKIISNAALHWILRDPSTRLPTLKACHAALKPAGLLVFEMGAAGNVAEAHAALTAALVHRGYTVAQVRDACPWFFPSAAWMRKTLEEDVGGFHVRVLDTEYRPTKLTTGEQRTSGLEGWLRFFAAQMLEALGSEEERDAAVREVCEVLKPIITREGEDGEYLGYVRLRVVAQKV